MLPRTAELLHQNQVSHSTPPPTMGRQLPFNTPPNAPHTPEVIPLPASSRSPQFQQNSLLEPNGYRASTAPMMRRHRLGAFATVHTDQESEGIIKSVSPEWAPQPAPQNVQVALPGTSSTSVSTSLRWHLARTTRSGRVSHVRHRHSTTG